MLPFLYNVWKTAKYGKKVEVDDPWGYGRSHTPAGTPPPPPTTPTSTSTSTSTPWTDDCARI
ncbi:hypothetical protein ACFWP5_19760, partial [Streptomyces sp. NPDC058469]|uniref:hypothetical protein n=1 Tax=Streptomyces sp. NPDC058469 TaxID=3346514 RepID=UPI003648FEB7